ncbi:hypothetical protein [Streptomyces sp. NPDC051211]|uniref:hypothetical protein n=1 Tax=Streptomyces sp. NPDC051211 TaxID=3154643 RepID=UPI00344B1DC3
MNKRISASGKRAASVGRNEGTIITGDVTTERRVARSARRLGNEAGVHGLSAVRTAQALEGLGPQDRLPLCAVE